MGEKADPDSRQIAEYAMALDLSSQLTQVLDEAEVLHRILEIFLVLFGPETIVFWVMENGAVTTTLTVPETGRVLPPPSDAGIPVAELTPGGFRMSLPSRGTNVGLLEVEGIGLPEYRERYLSLALAIAGVCGLAITNARTHTRLETALSDLNLEYARSSRLAAELKSANELLEERVRQRTAELEMTARNLEGEVSQRKDAETTVRNQLEEKTLLLRELNHRVKNNFQLIISILSTQARKVQDPSLQLALNESKNRIRTMAAVHEKLWAAQDLAHIDLQGYARYITSSLFSLYRIRPGLITLSLDIPGIVIDINTAIPVGLIVNELVANSLKHGFPEGTSGEIRLVIRDEGPALTILCLDNGTGLPPGYDWENPDTVGLVLVHSLVGQLQGTMAKEPGEGTGFFIRVQKVSGGTGPVRGTYNEIQA